MKKALLFTTVSLALAGSLTACSSSGKKTAVSGRAEEAGQERAVASDSTQRLQCQVELTDDNGFANGKLSFVVDTDGKNAAVSGLSSHVESIKKVSIEKGDLRIDGINARSWWTIWIDKSDLDSSKETKAVTISLSNGGGSQQGKGQCLSAQGQK